MNDPIRAALAPFAAITEDDFKGSIFEGKPDDTEVLHFHASGKEITMGDFRRARAALAAPAAPPPAAKAAPAVPQWPRVFGVSRDMHPRCLVISLAAEPTDDQVRAIHAALTTQGADRD